MAMIPMGDLPAYHMRRLGGERWCLRHGDAVLTWAELDQRSTRRASALKSLGVGRNDIVVLGLPNGNELFEWTFAIWKLGATPSMVSWRLPLHEFRAILQIARPKAVVASDLGLISALGALPASFGIVEGHDAPIVSQVGDHWKAMTSGGSTGRPKVIIDHMASAVDPDATVMAMPKDKVMLNPGPCYHNAPFASCHIALFSGNAVVGMPRFDAEEALRLIDQYRVAWVTLVPTMMNRIWQLPEETRTRFDISSLDRVWHMAAPMPAWLKDHWIQWIGPERLWELYGGTERQGLTVISGVEWLAHRGSVGKPVGCEVRILTELGEAARPGEVGEIFLRPNAGAGSTYHYLGADSKSTNDGFESIGDFGWLDDDGYLYISDRRTDLILSGGANIYPAEVENALMEHPGVEVAVVIGLPDDDMGALAHAIVKRNERAASPVTEAELTGFLSERLVRYKIPRSMEFTADQLRDDAGKVRRSQLRQERVDAKQSRILSLSTQD